MQTITAPEIGDWVRHNSGVIFQVQKRTTKKGIPYLWDISGNLYPLSECTDHTEATITDAIEWLDLSDDSIASEIHAAFSVVFESDKLKQAIWQRLTKEQKLKLQRFREIASKPSLEVV